ncbi:MAG: xanthine dehydrogenase family Fe-S subunit [Gammaproteobacteria bacterium]
MNAIAITVNGRMVKAEAQPRTHLADFLREELMLTGTHLGCEHGVCGACTVMIDGEPARSCIAFTAACDGADVKTVEGFEGDELMQALRDAFSRRHALQCGYCTPGMLITAYDVVRRLPDADRPRIREELAGNLCRCTGYVGIVDAISDVLSGPPPVPGSSPVAGDHRAPDSIANAGSHGVALPRAAGAPVAPVGSVKTVRPSGAAGGENHIERGVTVAAPADTLWRVLRDPRTVVRCLPGAELLQEPDAREPDDIRLELRLSVAIGPMRARFDGGASVHYDEARRRGRLQGSAVDSASRTSGDGSVIFELAPSTAGRTDLQTAIDYRLIGPLAQFSRGAVVDAVVDRLLAQFAQNLAAAASGAAVSDQRSLGGLRLVVFALWQRMRRLIGL